MTPARSLLTFLVLLLLSLSASANTPSPEVLEQFAREAEHERLRWKIPAMAIGLVEDGELTWFRGFGSKSAADPAPPDANTLFAIGSASKAFGSTTLAIAVDQGKVGWDDPVVDHLPEFAMSDPWITREFRLFDLFAQHPGVKPYALSALLSLGYTPERLMTAWRHVPRQGHFRSTFAYVNVPHLFAGKLVARLYDQPDWESAVEKLVLLPLGMTRTSGRSEVLEWPNRAPGHVLVDGELRQGESGTFPFNAGPAGSLSSTVNDLARWIDFQCGDGVPLLSRTNLMRTRQVQTMIDAETGYGMGWGVAFRSPHRLVWHTGGTLTHSCIVAFEPETKRGLVILTNLGDQNLPQPLAYRFFDLLYGHTGPNPLEQAWASREGSDPEEPPSSSSSSPTPAEELRGRYENEVLGALIVESDYRVTLEEIGMKAVLRPIAGDAFWLVSTDPGWVNLGLEKTFILQFQRDFEGRVVAVHAQQGPEMGLDTVLTRVDSDYP